MTKINDGGPAFPAKVSVNRDSGELKPHQFGNDDFCTPGLSLRDYFAAKAMQAMVGSPNYCNGEWAMGHLAAQAYELADVMLGIRGAQ